MSAYASNALGHQLSFEFVQKQSWMGRIALAPEETNRTAFKKWPQTLTKWSHVWTTKVLSSFQGNPGKVFQAEMGEGNLLRLTGLKAYLLSLK